MKTYVVGNWKMNFTVGEASLFLHRLESKIHPMRNLQIVVAPSTIALQPLSLQVDRRKLKLSAQNICPFEYGPYTGESSVSQLRSLVDYAIIGHSERRIHFHETDKEIKSKVSACIRAGITPILCIGETARERRDKETADVIRDQLLTALSDLTAEDLPRIIIAYEPVWAISSTKNSILAPPRKVEEVASLIRDLLKKTYSEDSAKKVPILFGGSVNPSNASAYLSLTNINGLLVGSSSLIVSEFTDIIDVAKRVKNE